MSQPMIILYDVPSNGPQPWVPNIWRIRLILNYKRLPYRTFWVEFPDVEKTMRAINAPPTSIRPDGRPVYTLPAILDPSHTMTTAYPGLPPPSTPSQAHAPVVLTHANTIADYLEQTYPARPVMPEGARALQALFVHYVSEIFVQPLLPIMVPLSHQRLPPHIQAHFPIPVQGVVPASSQIGSLDNVGAIRHQHPNEATRRREAQWAVVQTQFTFLSRILDKNAGDGDGDGTVAMGHELTYADFALCAVLIWIEKVAPHEGWARIREWDSGRWRGLWERCQAYMDVF